MALDLDKLILTSTASALRNFTTEPFTITVSGNIGASAQATFTGSASFERAGSKLRLYVAQDTIPTDGSVDYTTGVLLPCPPYGNSGTSPVYVKCSVAGSPFVTSIDATITPVFTSSGIMASILISNPNPGVMTLVTTTFTFRVVAFLPT